METNNQQPQILEHVPTPEELAEIYMRSGTDDPRSLFYNRTLVRPKPPIGWLLLCLAAIAAVSWLACFALGYITEKLIFLIPGAVLAGVLTALLLAKPLLVNCVKLYQAWAPDKLRKRCRYEPSCSVYMLQAVEKYGLWRGLCKGLKRWKGCKPPNGGYDLP